MSDRARSLRLGCLLLLAVLPALPPVRACELCAVYNAANAQGEFGSGLLLSISESFTAYRTLHFQGEEVTPDDPDYVDSSVTHVVGAWNFTERLGLSFNLPIVAHWFQRSEVVFSDTGSLFQVERGTEAGIGDASLVLRGTVFDKRSMDWGLVINLLGGVKFPTGDADRIKREVDQALAFEALLPPNTPHDPLGHSVSGVHEHRLALGSGSFDGIAGTTVNARWKRWFWNGQFQYYARTEGEAGVRFGDSLMVSGGPGRYLLASKGYSFSLQANAFYETHGRDEILGQKSSNTGMTSWFLGPLLFFTWGDRLTANAGVDIPLHTASRGLQIVPTYRVHGGISWRF